LPNLRGKKVRRKPEHVQTDYVDIPRVILDVHKCVTLVADVMLVNGIPFLVSSSRNINLITIEHVPQRTASKLGYLLQRIVRVYARAGFTVQTILMDNEFEKVRDHVHETVLNIPVAAEQIREIERKIRVIKKRSRGILCMLPYTHFPQQMLIHRLHHIVMWLNNFPVAGRVLDRFSPRELILRPFGAYCEVYKDNTPTNTMKTRGIPAICLGPTGNIQGTYQFPNLASGLVVKCHQFDELPAPGSVIQCVNSLAGTTGVPLTLVFANRHKVPFDWLANGNTNVGLDPTPVAAYPDIPAEMPGVILACHQPQQPESHDDSPTTKCDWSKLADDATLNADLDTFDHLPAPPEVIEIDDDGNAQYIVPVNTLPFRKRNSPHLSKLSLTSIQFAHNTQPPIVLLFPLTVPPVHVIFRNIFGITSSQRWRKRNISPPSTIPYGRGYRRGHCGPQ
jgi:hypothetical protein